ncbi:glucose-6-phosphate isomerase [Arthrobacter subterraneus]|uniref:glucose-6-phosphate isomerase n=1 Tax=Arthrobacter subterraneus TaxID=335973 RepID=UPI0037F6F6A9
MATLFVNASGAAAEAIERAMPELVEERVASRIMAKDSTLWGPESESEASVRLGWVDLIEASRALLPDIAQLRSDLHGDGVNHIVLCGMGGSSLAPEVITRSAGVELTVLDSTDPAQVRAALADRIGSTAVVVSSKSGSTVETDSQRRAFEQAFADAGVDPKSRIIIVTDPGSPLDESARAAGYRAVFTADPTVGGRYSALTAFGLVPSGLAGADLASLLDDAESISEFLTDDDAGNVGLRLGAVLGGTLPLRDKIVFVDEGSGIVGLGDWVEQLIAESTGKLGTGVLPVVVEQDAPELSSGAPDVLAVHLVSPESITAPEGDAITVGGSLGSQLLAWEFATAVAGRLLGINPFDQPDVEAAKQAARGLLDAQPESAPANFVDGAVEVRGSTALLGTASTLGEALESLFGALESNGYLAVQAYLDRIAEAPLAGIRPTLAGITGRPVTFGWGPRFLHSTGQFHKGGTPVGVFLQITGATTEDLAIPERPFSFGELITAQAAGDAQVLQDAGRPVLRLHLADRAEGLRQLQDVISHLSGRSAENGNG